MEAVARFVEYRYERPDGTLMYQEVVNSMFDRPWVPIVGSTVWCAPPPHEALPAPWVVKRREQGGEWVVIDDSESAIQRAADAG